MLTISCKKTEDPSTYSAQKLIAPRANWGGGKSHNIKNSPPPNLEKPTMGHSLTACKFNFDCYLEIYLKRNNKGPLNKPRRVHFGVTEGPRGFPEPWQSITMTINVFHDVMRVSRMFFLEKGNSALQNIQNHKSEGPCRAQ